jgi:hypothetical protein
MWVKPLDLSSAGNAAGAADLPHKPDLVFIFGPVDEIAQSPALRQLMELYPDAVQIGCSTGTSIQQTRLADEGLSALAIGFANTKVRLYVEPLADIAESAATGATLGGRLKADDLAGTFVLSHGLGVNGSALVHGLQSILGEDAMISGGLAGDGARFEQTLVAVNGAPVSGVVAALGFYGDAIRFAHGSAGGWDEFGPKRRITRSEGSVLFELDGKPALDLYESYLGDDAAGLPASGLLFPLKIWNDANPADQFVRTILAIDHDAKSITLAGDIPEGWSARLMRGSFDHLIQGASEAAQHACETFSADGIRPELCLFVSCVGRRLLMGQMTEDEVEAVADVIGRDVPILGYYSYGEIAPQNATKLCGLHNQTVTLTLLAEAA